MSRTIWLLPVFLTVLLVAGCGKQAAKPSQPQANSSVIKDFVQADDVTPEENRCLAVGRSFVTALAGRQYADAYALLSGAAKSRMSPNQFTPAKDDAEHQARETASETNVTADGFTRLMAAAETAYGQPAKPADLHVYSSDPNILSGIAKEDMDKLDIMFAIGNMPAAAHPDTRKASLRGQIDTQLTDAQLAEEAARQGTTADALKKDPDFRTYFNLKLVIVEDGGQLKVGYFELMPPSMLD